MCVVCQAVSAGAAALTGILPIAVPDPEAATPVHIVVTQSASEPVSIGGTTCKKTGQIRNTSTGSFKCTTVGNRRVWRRSAKAIATTSPTSSTTTTLPMPTDDVARKVYESVVAVLSQEPATTTNIEYISEEPADTVGEDAAKRGVGPAIRLFNQLGFALPNSVIVLFAKTEAGVRSNLIGQGCDSALLRSNTFEYLRSTGVAVGGSCGSNRVATVAGPVARWSRDQLSIDFQHTIPHELFHTWQMKDVSMCGRSRCGGGDFPVWLWEGTPQFMTRLAFWSWNRQRTHDQWFDQWYTVERRDQLSMCRDVKIEQMVQPAPSWPSPGACAYSKGQLAVEILVANYGGFDALKRLHTTKTTPGYSDFGTHFRNTTGRDLTEFYAEVNAYLTKRGMP
jgi:hypothetical protein